MTDQEVAAILADQSKRVTQDLRWFASAEDWVKFSAVVENDEGRPLTVGGSYNRAIGKISISLRHPGVKGRLYGLEIGSAHRYRDGSMLEETHKHRWNEALGVANIYIPNDITAGLHQVVEAWQEFCAEAAITHTGTLAPPPGYQDKLDLE